MENGWREIRMDAIKRVPDYYWVRTRGETKWEPALWDGVWYAIGKDWYGAQIGDNFFDEIGPRIEQPIHLKPKWEDPQTGQTWRYRHADLQELRLSLGDLFQWADQVQKEEFCCITCMHDRETGQHQPGCEITAVRNAAKCLEPTK